MSAVIAPVETPVEVKLLKLDLACGQVCQQGFEGVDIAAVDGVKHVHDLNVYPWPFEDSSVDEARSSHYLEHLDGLQQIEFMNELWRILKNGSGALITTPYGHSVRAWQDPTHLRPIFAESYLYYNRPWREANKLTHGPYERIKCNFDISFPWQAIDSNIAARDANAQQWMTRFYVNAINDITALVVARK
jgi:SAM-dependent methyltransferase